MCDTIIATADVTSDGVAIFAKNSDREPNEAQHVVHVPAADHSANSIVRCTYIDIPQKTHTHAVMLSKPFWMWGAEMGANEHGVVIGNEAVFTRMPYIKQDALTGMDLLRLGLERATTAREALAVITSLLEEFGQGGNCGYQHKMFYHNSYILADPSDAWVLETAGRHWAAKHIRGIYTISNGLTIGKEFDIASDELVKNAVEKGWCKNQDDFDFARCYSDFLYTHFSDSRSRCGRTTGFLKDHSGNITIQTAMATLRLHRDGNRSPGQGITGADVCMHAGFGPVRGSQTVGSQVSYLDPDHLTHFFTATSAPCTSLFKPVWMDTGWRDLEPAPTGVYDPDTVFWRHEILHRLTIKDYHTCIQVYQQELHALEEQFIDTALAVRANPAAERLAFTEECFAQSQAVEERWIQNLVRSEIMENNGYLYRSAWRTFNRQANIPSMTA